MGNITAIYPDRDLTVDEVLSLFREVNEARFGGLFTIEQLADHPTVIEFTIEGIEGIDESVHKRWRNCFFDFYFEGPRRITSKWAHPSWVRWLYQIVKHEFGTRCGAVHNDEDDPADEPWESNPSKFTTYRAHLGEMYRFAETRAVDDIYDTTIEGCPAPILALLEGR